MIFVVNRALGLLNGGAENFDVSMVNNVFHDQSGVCVFCGDKQKVKKVLGPSVEVVSPKTPFLRILSYRFSKYIRISSFFYILDNLIFELCFIIFFILKNNRGLNEGPKIVYCCSLFLIPIITAPFFKQYTFVSWLPGPPGKLVQKKIKILKRYPNFRLFTRGYPEKTLVNLKLEKNIDYFILPPALKAHWLSASISNPSKAHPDGKVNGVTTARLVPIKDLEFLIDCLAHCNQNGLQFSWSIIGDGTEKARLESKIKNLGLMNCVTLHGELPHEEVKEILLCSDVFVLSSRFENYSNAVLESFACGVPCLLRDVGYMPNLVGNGERGYLFSSPKTFYLRLLELISDDYVRNEMRKNCVSFAKRHNWELINQTFWENVH